MRPPLTPESELIETAFHIVNKDGKRVPFSLNEVQRYYDSVRTRRDIILKARQEGFSAFIDAIITAECMTKENLRCVLIAHDRLSTQVLFDRVKFYCEHLVGGEKPDFSRSSRRELFFRKKNSTFYIGTAGYEEFGRGDTIHRLHCSEVASWPNPVELTSGLFEAVPQTGTIWLESTAKGRGNWFHLRCMRAIQNESIFKLHFFPWFALSEYETPTNLIEGNLTSEERTLVRKHGLSMRQMQWRRHKLQEMDNSETLFGGNMFPQEYPATPEEAFLASGMSVFGNIPTAKASVKEQSRFLTLWQLPKRDHQYVIGVDVGAGVGADRSVASILDCDKLEQVGEWVSDCVDPAELASYLCELGERFNNAYISPEVNNHGIATVESLRRLYPIGLIIQRYQYDKRASGDAGLDKLGFLTTQKTKEVALSDLRRALASDLRVPSAACRSEMSTFVQHENGKLGAQTGCYDDRVMALALAVTGMRYQYRPKPPPRKRKDANSQVFTFEYQREQAIKAYLEDFGAFPDTHDHGLKYYQ